MAEDRVRILRVEVPQGDINSVKQLAEALEVAKGKVSLLEEGTDEYYKALAQQKGIQSEYNRILRQTAKESVTVQGSYYEMNNRLVQLRHAYKSLGDVSSEEAKQMLAEIKKLDKQLKEFDHTIGQDQRNVGNYAGEISKIAGLFGSAGQSAGGAVSGVMGFTGALQAASKTPIIAILGLLVTALGKVAEQFRSSEATANKLTVAFAPLKAIGDASTRMFQALASKVADVSQKFMDLLMKLNIFNGEQKAAMQERRSIAEANIAITNKEREVQVENAKAQAEAERLRNEAAQVSGAARSKLLKEALVQEESVMKRNLELAELRYNTYRREAELSENDAAMNDKLAQAEADLYNTRREYYSRTKEIQSGILASTKGVSRETVQALTDEQVALKQLIEDIGNVDFDKIASDRQAAWNKLHEIDIQAGQELGQLIVTDTEATAAEALRVLDEFEREQERAYEAEVQRNENRKALLFNYAGATSDILGSIADAWEASGDLSEQEAERVKGLRVAGAIIQTLAGSIAAYMGMVESIPGPIGIASGVVAGAAVLASGYAQVAKIKATDAKGQNGGSSAGASSSSFVQPRMQYASPAVAVETGTASETAINRVANEPIKAYIVASEAEAYQKEAAQRKEEASF